MLEINPKIKYIRIVSSHIEISRNLPKTFELKVGCRAKIKTPKDEEEKKAVLDIALNIETAEKNDISINLEADVLWEFDQIPEDYEKIIEEECMPIAQTQLFNRLDDILVKMGYKKLGLGEKEEGSVAK